MSATSSRVQGLLDRTRRLKAGGTLPPPMASEPSPQVSSPPRPVEEKIDSSPKSRVVAGAPGPVPQPPADLSTLMRTLNISEQVKTSSSSSSTPPLTFRSIEPRMARPRIPKSTHTSSRSSSGSSTGRRLRSPLPSSKPDQIAVSISSSLRSFQRKSEEYMKQQGSLSEQLQKMVKDQISSQPADDRIRMAEE